MSDPQMVCATTEAQQTELWLAMLNILPEPDPIPDWLTA